MKNILNFNVRRLCLIIMVLIVQSNMYAVDDAQALEEVVVVGYLKQNLNY